MQFQIDPNEIFKQVIGPLGGYVLLGLFFLGFAWPKPWFYFAREVDHIQRTVDIELKEKDVEISRLNVTKEYLMNENKVLLQIAKSGTSQGSQVANIAKQLAELATGKTIDPEN